MKKNNWGVYWQRDGALISDRDENGKDFIVPWQAYEWALKNLFWPDRDREWYVALVLNDNQTESQTNG